MREGRGCGKARAAAERVAEAAAREERRESAAPVRTWREKREDEPRRMVKAARQTPSRVGGMGEARMAFIWRGREEVRMHGRRVR